MAKMISGMLADNVDDRHLRSARIVQISKAIGETRAKMKQSTGRFAHHASITVCGSRHHTLEETEHATHFGHPVKCSNDMYFRSARVREAGLNPASDQRANQTFRPVHLCLPIYVSVC